MLNEQQALFLLSGSCLHDMTMHLMHWEELPGAQPYTVGTILGCWIRQRCLDPICLHRMRLYIRGGNHAFRNPSSGIESTCVLHRPSGGRCDSHHLPITRLKISAQQIQLAEHKNPLLQGFQLLSSAPASLCLLACLLIKPLPDHELIRMLWWGKYVGAPWHHTKVQCHGWCHKKADYYICNIYMIAFSPLSQSYLRSGKQTGKAAGGPCGSRPCWVMGEVMSLGGIMLGQCCGLQPASCTARRSTSISIMPPRRSILLPQGPAEKPPRRWLGCTRVLAGSSVTAIAWWQAHDVSAHPSSSAAFLHINMLKTVNIRNISNNIRESQM